MKSAFTWGLVGTVLALSACSSHTQTKASGAAASGSLTTNTPEAFKALSILSNNCASCHGGGSGSGGLSQILDPNALVQGGWITPGNATSSLLYQSIAANRMPPTGPLSAADVAAIATWINQGASGNSIGAPSLPPLGPTFASISANVLMPKCVACHNSTQAKGGRRYDNYSETKKGVVVGNHMGSELYTITQSGKMPQNLAPLSATELQAIAQWIDDGALNN